jgi:hypothetical protein
MRNIVRMYIKTRMYRKAGLIGIAGTHQKTALLRRPITIA